MAGQLEAPRGLTICPACGATHEDGRTCQDDFHQFLFWENEEPARGVVHHLMVLCYHLQHPSLYSREGLAYSRALLADFVERDVSPEEARRRNREVVDSGRRDWSVTARPGNQGAYEQPVQWTMTAADVVAGGANLYVENVKSWAASVNDALRASEARL
jgi:hypothetical protein